MSVQITLNTITGGTSPYDIWVCDECGTAGTCQYIATTSTIPYSFILPAVFETYLTYVVKIIDSNGCEYCFKDCDYKQFQDGECFEFMDGDQYDFQ
jgi:hypothetical protein